MGHDGLEGLVSESHLAFFSLSYFLGPSVLESGWNEREEIKTLFLSLFKVFLRLKSNQSKELR